MASLAAIAPKLRKLIPLLSSSNEGEQLATVSAINRTLAGAGLTVHDLAEAINAPAARSGSEPAGNDRAAPIWIYLDTRERIAWLTTAAMEAGPGSWLDQFAMSISRHLVEGRPLTPKQTAKAQTVLDEAWRKGLRP